MKARANADDIPDSYTEGFYRLVEGEPWCCGCGGPLKYDPECDCLRCVKCGREETE